MPRIATVVLASVFILLPAGCPPEDYPSLLPPTLTEVQRVLDNQNLTPQQQRLQLEQLGLSPTTINAFLKDKPLGNQNGGDLRTAYQKITEPDFTALTPDEIQIWASAASALDSEDDINFKLTDQQAQLMVDFFNNNGVRSKQQLTTFLSTSADLVPAEIPENALQALFIDLDPTDLLPQLP